MLNKQEAEFYGYLDTVYPVPDELDRTQWQIEGRCPCCGARPVNQNDSRNVFYNKREPGNRYIGHSDICGIAYGRKNLGFGIKDFEVIDSHFYIVWESMALKKIVKMYIPQTLIDPMVRTWGYVGVSDYEARYEN